jgi:hypothetical protein
MPDAVIVAAVRTPIGRHGGALKDVRPDDLAALVLKEVMARARVDPALVEEVYLGCANQAGEDNRNVARMATLLAGFPVSVAAVTFNRLCASGLAADIEPPPLFRGATLDQGLHGGEDYELLFTLPPRARPPREFEGVPLTRIGVMRRGAQGEVLMNGATLAALGYDHLRR